MIENFFIGVGVGLLILIPIMMTLSLLLWTLVPYLLMRQNALLAEIQEELHEIKQSKQQPESIFEQGDLP